MRQAREALERPMTARKLAAGFFLASLLLPVPAWACELGATSPWFASDAELVAGTRDIFVGRVVGQRTDTDDRTEFRQEYEMEVVERIKGTPPPRVWIGSFTPASRPDDRGRVSLGPDCKMQAKFESGRTYLIFREAYHPKGYELIASDRDAWLATVRRLALN
jgi:hypothetical protein